MRKSPSYMILLRHTRVKPYYIKDLIRHDYPWKSPLKNRTNFSLWQKLPTVSQKTANVTLSCKPKTSNVTLSLSSCFLRATVSFSLSESLVFWILRTVSISKQSTEKACCCLGFTEASLLLPAVHCGCENKLNKKEKELFKKFALLCTNLIDKQRWYGETYIEFLS